MHFFDKNRTNNSSVSDYIPLSFEIDSLSDLFAQDNPTEWKSYQRIPVLTNDDARDAVVRSGLCTGSNDAIALIQSVANNIEFATGLDLRKAGVRIDKDGLKARGLRTNVILTFECWELLTPKGQRDPIAAAQFILSAYMGRLHWRNGIGRAQHAGVKEVRIVPNNMAAGPCGACLLLSTRTFAIQEAPVCPLKECPHPDQCATRFRSVVDIEQIDDDE